MFYRLRALLRRNSMETELDAELRAHVEQQAEKYVQAGMSPEEAARRVRLEFGGIEQVKEECRDTWGVRFVSELTQDIRYGLRQLRRNPGFTLIAVITLALGIAVNTTIFSAISLVLLKKPTFPNPGRLMMVFANNKAKSDNYLLVSAPNFIDFQRQNDVFDGMAADADHGFTLTGTGSPEHLIGAEVTANFFRVLGLSPAIGRDFLFSENEPGRNAVVILSHGFWKQHFASNPNVIGRTVEIDDQPHKVIGVMSSGTDTPLQQVQLWTPVVFTANDLSEANRSFRNLYVFARLRPSVKPERARAEIAAIASRIAQSQPEIEKSYGASALTVQKYMTRAAQVEASLTMLMGAVGFVLLIACANIAGLLLARADGRRQEMALRVALGAGRVRVIQQLLTEGLLIGLAGGGLGAVLGFWGIRFLRTAITWDSYALYLSRNLRLDAATLWFTIAITLGATLLFGLAPAVHASKSDPVAGLKEGGRSRTGGFASSRMRSVYVAGEIALSVVLLVGAGLFVETFIAMQDQNLGFNSKHLITAQVSLSNRRYGNTSKQAEFFGNITEKLHNLPGVESASVAWPRPLSIWGSQTVRIGGRINSATAHIYVVGSGYFKAMEIPLLKGREFSRLDNARSANVAVVSRAFAEKYFPNRNVIGNRVLVKTTEPAWAEIVGIVGNVNEFPGQPNNDPQVYEPYTQHPSLNMALVARTHYAAAACAPLLRRAVWSVDKDEPVEHLMTMQEAETELVGGESFSTGLLGALAAMALLLSAIGIYGVIAYSVSRRTHEIGIRTALGAQKSDVLQMILKQGGLLTLVGCAIGISLSFPLPKLFAGMYGSGFTGGQGALAVAAAAVALVSIVATYIPARRATKVDPMVALRYE
ncbi:MAG TPA: ABC transporter permease [Terriglobia bacterium]|nr:ABC transporter permease [Terriglobia bacterium]